MHSARVTRAAKERRNLMIYIIIYKEDRQVENKLFIALESSCFRAIVELERGMSFIRNVPAFYVRGRGRESCQCG